MNSEIISNQKQEEEDENFPTKKLKSLKLDLINQSPEDLNKYLEEFSNWFKEEVAAYVESHDAYMMGYHFEELITDLVNYLERLALKTKTGEEKIEPQINKKETYKDDEDEGMNNGEIDFMGQKILEYSVTGEGYGMRITEWYERNLQKALLDLLKQLEKFNKKI